MAESSAGDFTVGKIQQTRRQRVAKMYGQQKRNIIHMSSTAYEQDHSAAAPPSSVMNSRRLIRSPRRRFASTPGGIVRPRALAVLRLITSSNLVVRGHSGPTQQRHTGLGCAGLGCAPLFATCWKQPQAAWAALSSLP